MAKLRSDSERKEILGKVVARIKSGASNEEATKAEGISVATLYNWRKAGSKAKASRPERKFVAKVKQRRKVPAPNLVQLQVPAAEGFPLVVLMGSPIDVRHALDRLSDMKGVQ